MFQGRPLYHRFNPHTHTGCDAAPHPHNEHSSSFNPHTHTGCDTIETQAVREAQGFNPHTHTGCDLQDDQVAALAGVSIHTPIQGVTHHRVVSLLPLQVSIHTPIQGVTQSLLHARNAIIVSIHTPIQGVTVGTYNCSFPLKFQSTHPYRV